MKIVEKTDEMITLTNKHLLQTKFIPTLRKLYNMSVFDAKTAYRIHKIFDQIGKPYQECWNDFLALGAKYALVDEKGIPNMHPEGSPRAGQHVVDPEKIPAYEEEMKKLLETSFGISQHKLSAEQLTVRFSGEEIAALEPIVEGLE
jgi:hypothetical protein